MSAIVGIAKSQQSKTVKEMLSSIKHRGDEGSNIFNNEQVTEMISWTKSQAEDGRLINQDGVVRDYTSESCYALAFPMDSNFFLKRDPIGLAPLYYGNTKEGDLCFASEVKALLSLTRNIHELPPGTFYDGEKVHRYFSLEEKVPLADPPEILAVQLKGLLTGALRQCITGNEIGSWLSGGLDSSALAALARPMVSTLHTFSAGYADSEDIKASRQVAEWLNTQHHEKIVTCEDLIAILPKVIYHLESFDALLVRSTLINYLVAGMASEYVGEVLSGEGGDELFGGYAYLKSLQLDELPRELIDITQRLHNTALQRVDRSASAHGLVAHVCFLNRDVVDFALRIPSKYKIHNGEEKWILRLAVKGLLPETILHRRKAKFWHGAGLNDDIAKYANSMISDDDFKKGRRLPNGWLLNSKEEFLFYKIFRDQFGEFEDLAWMGRTKGAPVQ